MDNNNYIMTLLIERNMDQNCLGHVGIDEWNQDTLDWGQFIDVETNYTSYEDTANYNTVKCYDSHTGNYYGTSNLNFVTVTIIVLNFIEKLINYVV